MILSDRESCKAQQYRMRIHRSIEMNGSILPSAEAIIRAIPAEFLHHEAHGLKHPLAVYQTSLARVGAAWTKIFPLLHTLRFEVMGGVEHQSYSQVLQAYEALLYRLNEHVDAAYEILRSLLPPDGKSYFSHAQALKTQKLAGYMGFRDVVQRGWRESHIGAIVNLLKHESAQLRAVCGETEDDILLGFYVDGPRPGGFIGPNLKVHRRFGMLETAFTFARDMLMHFWWIYRTGDALTECIHAAVLKDHGRKLVENPGRGAQGVWQDVCLGCAQVRPAFFIDECQKNYPLVVVPPDASEVRLDFPSGRVASGHRHMKLRVLIGVTEMTRSFVMPYMQKRGPS